MPKPILVVNYCVEGLPLRQAIENIKQIRDVVENSGANEEYYTFVLPVMSDSHIQVFYDKDIDNHSFNNMRDLIDEKLEEFESAIDPEFIVGEVELEEEHIPWWKKIIRWKR